MRLSLAAARKYALIIRMRLLAVISMSLLTVLQYVHVLFIESTASTASLSDEDAVYLVESVVGGLHICKRVQSLTVCEGLQLTREDGNDDRFSVCLQVHVFLVCLSGGWPSRVVWKQCFCLCHLCNLRTEVDKLDTCNKRMR